MQAAPRAATALLRQLQQLHSSVCASQACVSGGTAAAAASMAVIRGVGDGGGSAAAAAAAAATMSSWRQHPQHQQQLQQQQQHHQHQHQQYQQQHHHRRQQWRWRSSLPEALPAEATHHDHDDTQQQHHHHHQPQQQQPQPFVHAHRHPSGGALVLDGRAAAADWCAQLEREVPPLARRLGRRPGLAVVLVGGRPDSLLYVGRKQEACARVGVHCRVVRLPERATQAELVAAVAALSDDRAVDGLLVQLPLPPHLDEEAVMAHIAPRKDVDGFHPANMGRMLMRGRARRFVPATPLGVVELLSRSGVRVAGKTAVVLGDSNIVGTPLAALLRDEGAALVTTCHRASYAGLFDGDDNARRRRQQHEQHEQHGSSGSSGGGSSAAAAAEREGFQAAQLPAICRTADVLVVAVGSPELVRAHWVKPGAVVVDVGINLVADDDGGGNAGGGLPGRGAGAGGGGGGSSGSSGGSGGSGAPSGFQLAQGSLSDGGAPAAPAPDGGGVGGSGSGVVRTTRELPHRVSPPAAAQQPHQQQHHQQQQPHGGLHCHHGHHPHPGHLAATALELTGLRVVGDVAHDEVARVASVVTPVPGGVGPMTIAAVLSNTLQAARYTAGLLEF